MKKIIGFLAFLLPQISLAGGLKVDSAPTGQTNTWTVPQTFATTVTVQNSAYLATVSGGRVGIGTSSPLTPLHINYDNTANGILLIQPQAALAAGANNILRYINSAASSTRFAIRENGTTGVIDFVSQDTTGIVSFLSGNVGIGTTPSTKLHVLGADDSTVITSSINATQANITGSDVFMSFNSNTGQEGSIAGTGVAGVIAFNTFTGSHWTKIEGKKPELLTPLCSTGELFTVKEQLVKSEVCQDRKSKKILGFFGGSDKNGTDLALALGTGFAWVKNTGSDIEIGDWLFTSGDGLTVEKQTEEEHFNYSAAKSLQSIKWQSGEKKRKIAVTYHAG